MSMRDCKPRFEMIDTDAKRFAARMTRGGRLGVLRLPFLEDAWGGLEAGQPELVVEALLSMIDNAIVVYLAYRDVEVAPGSTPVETLLQVEPALGKRAWALISEETDRAEEIGERARRVMQFAEFELGIAGAVPSWSGRVTESEYLQYRYESVYPAILLAERVGALSLFPVPGTYLELSHEAETAGHVTLSVLSGR